MTLNYPNGQHYSQKQSTTFKAKHKSPSRIVYGNRGMTLEQEINDSNQYYLERRDRRHPQETHSNSNC